MSKPISISFGKSKSPSAVSTTSGPLGRKPISFSAKPIKPALRHDSDDEDEQVPLHEEVTGFAADGAVLSRPVAQKNALVIKNAGNGDWRTRGKKNLLPAEVQAQRAAEANGQTALVEKNEISKASGLQLAESEEEGSITEENTNGDHAAQVQPVKKMTEDELALQALLDGDNGKRKTDAVIIQAANARPQGIDETDDFKADVASRPDNPTLDEYAAMPVEEFGLAMLRGMGQKRKANGEIMNYGSSNGEKKAPKIREARQGYLGIGAKAAPDAEAELGAWGKADMRKNKKGEGLYTPVMLRDKRTGEMITEQELEERKEAKQKKPSGDDWRDRRDRNLWRSGHDSKNGEQKYITDKDDYRDQMNEFSRSSPTRKDRDGDDSARPRHARSRSRDRSKREDDDRHRDRRHDKYRDEERYDSSSSRKSSHRDRDRDHRRRER